MQRLKNQRIPGYGWRPDKKNYRSREILPSKCIADIRRTDFGFCSALTFPNQTILCFFCRGTEKILTEEGILKRQFLREKVRKHAAFEQEKK